MKIKLNIFLCIIIIIFSAGCNQSTQNQKKEEIMWTSKDNIKKGEVFKDSDDIDYQIVDTTIYNQFKDSHLDINEMDTLDLLLQYDVTLPELLKNYKFITLKVKITNNNCESYIHMSQIGMMKKDQPYNNNTNIGPVYFSEGYLNTKGEYYHLNLGIGESAEIELGYFIEKEIELEHFIGIIPTHSDGTNIIYFEID